MSKPKIRVRKARWDGKIGCGHWVRKGEQIISTNGRWFMCTECRERQTGQMVSKRKQPTCYRSSLGPMVHGPNCRCE